MAVTASATGYSGAQNGLLCAALRRSAGTDARLCVLRKTRFTPDRADRAYLASGRFTGNALMAPRLRCGIVLHAEEDACQVLAGGQITSVRYASQFPAPRRERVLPGHLVAVAEVPGGPDVVVWRWYDAVVLGSEAGSVRLWEPAHGEVVAQPRQPGQRHDPGTRAYLSAGLPGAGWWVAGKAADRAEDADVELSEVERLYTEHGMWESALSQ